MQQISENELGPWLSVEPSEAVTWLAHIRTPWWFAGGWALDLFLNQTSRVHADLDVGVLRRDVCNILMALPDWEHFEAHEGVLTRLATGATPCLEVSSLWCRPIGAVEWAVQVMLDESNKDQWLFRRQPTIRRPLTTLTRSTASGLKYLAPEIQLLYKAKAVRAKDQADFERVAPRLDSAARSWLRDALRRTSPGHSWLAAL